jgi:hypothetical protein
MYWVSILTKKRRAVKGADCRIPNPGKIDTLRQTRNPGQIFRAGRSAGGSSATRRSFNHAPAIQLSLGYLCRQHGFFCAAQGERFFKTETRNALSAPLCHYPGDMV